MNDFAHDRHGNAYVFFTARDLASSDGKEVRPEEAFLAASPGRENSHELNIVCNDAWAGAPAGYDLSRREVVALLEALQRWLHGEPIPARSDPMWKEAATKDTQRIAAYSDGNIPAGFLPMPEDWKPDQIEAMKPSGLSITWHVPRKRTVTERIIDAILFRERQRFDGVTVIFPNAEVTMTATRANGAETYSGTFRATGRVPDIREPISSFPPL